MTTSEIIEIVAKKNNLSRARAQLIVQTILQVIRSAILKDQRVHIRGIGTFKLVIRNPRRIIDPRTGKLVTYPRRKKLKFIPASTMVILV